MQKKIEHKHQDFVGETPEEQAAFWVYRLQDRDCSARDEAAFVQWHANSSNQEAFANAKTRYQQLMNLRQAYLSAGSKALKSDTASTGEECSTGRAQVKKSAREQLDKVTHINKKRRWFIGGAASFAAAASILLALFLMPRVTGLRSTTVGEIANFDLDDGSVIVLDTASTIEIEYNDELRKVTLKNGRAFFKVKSDPSRPFVVQAGKQSVRVVGTEFTVHNSDSSQRVALKEGKVQVATGMGGETVGLKPGQALESSKGSSSRIVDIASAEEEFSWTEGILYFESNSLEEVVARINRYSDRKLILSSDALKQKSISGRYTVGELDSFLTVLNTMFDFSLHYDEDGNVTISDASN